MPEYYNKVYAPYFNGSKEKGYETCVICDIRTGRAGRGEDSLFDLDGGGPYCTACWDNLPKEKKYEENR